MNYSKSLLPLFLLSFLLGNLTAKTDHYRCMWRDNPSTTMVIGWTQASGEDAVVYYGEQDLGIDYESYPYQHKVDRTTRKKGLDHAFARLTNLKPGTTYYFVIKDSNSTSGRYYFQTIPNHEDARLAIIAGGDSRNNRSSRQSANLAVAKLKAHFVLFGGDMTAGDTSWEWKVWLDDWMLSIAADGRITPIVAARGNHERDNSTIHDIFDTPNPRNFYAITFGDNLLRAYTLNTLVASNGEQGEWLEKDLSNHPDIVWKIAQYHQPMRPHTAKKKERHDLWNNWAFTFYQYQMDLVVECDAHVVKQTFPIKPSKAKSNEEGFERDDQNGTVYVGEGCWGAPLRPNNDDKSWTQASGSFNQFKWIFVDKKAMEVRTVMTDDAASFSALDSPFEFTPDVPLWSPPSGKVLKLTPRSSENLSTATSLQSLNVTTDRFSAILKWTVNNEKGNTYFVVERSIDEKPFEEIGKLQGLNEDKESTNNDYVFYDKNVAIKQPKSLVYRIRLGSNTPKEDFLTEKVSTLLWEGTQFEPLATDIDLLEYDEGATELRVLFFDENQKAALVKKLKVAYQTLETKELPKGKYVMIILEGNRVIEQKFVEKK